MIAGICEAPRVKILRKAMHLMAEGPPSMNWGELGWKKQGSVINVEALEVKQRHQKTKEQLGMAL